MRYDCPRFNRPGGSHIVSSPEDAISPPDITMSSLEIAISSEEVMM